MFLCFIRIFKVRRMHGYLISIFIEIQKLFMLKRILFFSFLFFLVFQTYSGKSIVPVKKYDEADLLISDNSFTYYSSNLYNNFHDNNLNFEAFKYGLRGYFDLQNKGQIENSKYLTIIDMSSSSNTDRFFIINMDTHEIEHKSLVAHGKNSGEEYAEKFSNVTSSYQTSLGFYKTSETYIGKHGISLRLDGLEYSNSNARERAIVIHAADYATENFIAQNGRLGRSYGCPALPNEGYDAVIEKIKEGSCLFIYYPQATYLKNSKLANASDPIIAFRS